MTTSTESDGSKPVEQSSAFGDALAIARYHIVLVAMCATLVFGWLISGRYLWALSVVVGLDWFLINLMNRVTDVDEDLKNNIAGTDRVAKRKTALTVTAAGLMVGSFVLSHLVWPQLTVWRFAVQVIGLGYNYNLVPTPWGMRRFKELYFFKNFGSSVIFTLTCFAYPWVMAENHLLPLGTVALLVAFFVPFELTYEILYDMRDLEGDRAEGVPTYPVVHGNARSRQIIDGLLLACALPLIAALTLGRLGVREALMLAAPLIQFLFYRPRYRRGLTPSDCIWLTHLGSLLLLFYLAGNAVWLRAGLPANIMFG